MNATEENRALVTHIMHAMESGDTKPYVEAMADDFTWVTRGHGVWGKTYVGKEACRFQLFAPLFKQYEGRYTNTPLAIYADGDRVIVESEGRATTKAGKAYNNRYCLVIRLAGGKMREVREYMDTELASACLDPSVF